MAGADILGNTSSADNLNDTKSQINAEVASFQSDYKSILGPNAPGQPPNQASEWAILSSNDLDSPYTSSLQNDPFINFVGLNTSDFRQPYSYELCIFDGVNVIDSIVLPIAPQHIQMTTPPAINTTVTMKGIIEEHNGAPLRNITISGTMGVAPIDLMQSGTQSSSNAITSYLNTIFKNTIQSVNA